MPEPVSNGNYSLGKPDRRGSSIPVAGTCEHVLETVGGGALARRGFGLRFWDGGELPGGLYRDHG